MSTCAGRETVRAASAVVRGNRREVSGYVCRARAYLSIRNYRRALSDLSYAIQLQPQNADLYLERARLFLTRDNTRRALRDLDKSIAQKRTARALAERSAVFADLGEFNRAIDDLNAAIQLQPASSDLYMQRGALYVQYESFKLAERESDVLALALTGGQDVALALNDFTFAAELNRDDPQPFYGMAQARRRLAADDVNGAPTRYDEAVASAERALAIKADFLPALLIKADLLALKDDYQAAMGVADQAVALAPQQPAPYSLRGRIRLDRRDFEGALRDAGQAIQIDRAWAESYCVRASALAETGQKSRALRDFNLCQRLAKDFDTREWAALELNALSIPANMR
jgi:tetratricopeptide (TPR) repeat protein